MIVPVCIVVSFARANAIALERWHAVRVEQMLASGCSALSIVALWATGTLTTMTAIASVLGSQLVGGLSYVRPTPTSLPVGTESPRSGEIVGFALRSWVGAIAGVAVSRLDQSLMTSLSGTQELGLYAVAVSIAELPLIISGAISVMAFSADATQPSDDRLGSMSRIATSVCACVSLLIGLSSPALYRFVIGGEFMPAIPSTLILCSAVVIGIPGSIAGSGLAARGLPGTRSLGLATAAVVNVVVLLLVAPANGANGAAFATLCSTALATTWSLLFMYRRANVNPSIFFGFRRSDASAIRRSIEKVGLPPVFPFKRSGQ